MHRLDQDVVFPVIVSEDDCLWRDRTWTVIEHALAMCMCGSVNKPHSKAAYLSLSSPIERTAKVVAKGDLVFFDTLWN